MFAGLAKKKKKSSKSKKEGEEETPAADGEFDPSALKKKKKKSTKKTTDADDFEAKLAQAGAAENDDAEDEPVAAKKTLQDGDMDKGTGIWQHSDTTAIEYPLLLTRFFSQLHEHNPDAASSGGKSYKIPPPQCLREGNKKTIFANIAEICKRMKRTDEHVTQFLFAELGTSGSVDGSRRLVIKGRFQQKQIENVLRRYIGIVTLLPFLPKPHANTFFFQSNTSPARPAALLIPNSTRVKTDSTSSPATPVDLAVPSPPSRLVSPPRSAREEDSKVKLVCTIIEDCGAWLAKSPQESPFSLLSSSVQRFWALLPSGFGFASRSASGDFILRLSLGMRPCARMKDRTDMWTVDARKGLLLQLK